MNINIRNRRVWRPYSFCSWICVGWLFFGYFDHAHAKDTADIEMIYDSALSTQWEDRGWAPRDINTGKAARLNFTNHEGWILARPNLKGSFTQLSFALNAPSDLGNFLEVRLASDGFDRFPRILVTPQFHKRSQGGWQIVQIPFKFLNPENHRFNQLIFSLSPQTNLSSGQEVIFDLDKIALYGKIEQAEEERSFNINLDSTANETEAATLSENHIKIACQQKSHRISPYIYGIAYNPQHNDASQWKIKPTIRRWGGNPASRYNYRIGSAWNTGMDWFFLNVNYTHSQGLIWKQFFQENAQHKIPAALTVPMLGWVAKDMDSYSYSVKKFGPQQSVSPHAEDMGNGKRANGSPILQANPRDTSIPAPAKWVGYWMRSIQTYRERKGYNPAEIYFLDNEPSLWNSTHQDVHPQPMGYDELLERSIQYAQQIRRNIPDARIAGPCEWGWPAYFYSALDQKMGFQNKPDRLAHGDTPYLAWYLQQMYDYEQQHGEKLLDILDVHFYPQGLGMYGREETDNPERRIRATRALWDESYVDESWINDRIYLLPRLKSLIQENYPGLKISIGEYNFGGENTMGGALALAETLGLFGKHNIYSAFYWTTPPANSFAEQAFLAYRDYDGRGSSFPEESISARARSPLSVFAAKDSRRERVVVILLNLSNQRTFNGQIELEGCGAIEGYRGYRLEATRPILQPVPSSSFEKISSSTLKVPIKRFSLNVVELSLDSKASDF